MKPLIPLLCAGSQETADSTLWALGMLSAKVVVFAYAIIASH
jgi:hypothetical protein